MPRSQRGTLHSLVDSSGLCLFENNHRARRRVSAGWHNRLRPGSILTPFLGGTGKDPQACLSRLFDHDGPRPMATDPAAARFIDGKFGLPRLSLTLRFLPPPHAGEPAQMQTGLRGVATGLRGRKYRRYGYRDLGHRDRRRYWSRNRLRCLSSSPQRPGLSR